MGRRYWLMKSEPEVFSIDDLQARGREPWSGVRNYQARNFMRDLMRVGDLALFYHSSCTPAGVAGVARIASPPLADPTAWDPSSPYHDPGAPRDPPRWVMVEVAFVERFPRLVSRAELAATPGLSGLMVLRRGMRLSIQPVTAREFRVICRLGRRTGPQEPRA